MIANSKTHNGANSFEHTENYALEFFSKAGAMYVNKGTFYGDEIPALKLFKDVWRADKLTAMKLAFWLRDCRGGAGNRSGFRSIIKWLAESEDHFDWINANIDLIPKYGRWDDLKVLYGTLCETHALEQWKNGILGEPTVSGLACKWADRQDLKLREHMKLSPKELRKLLVLKTKVVESDMCRNNWSEIEYNHVPSVATARYKKAFLSHDKERYDAWRANLSKPESGAKVNASVLLPHDIIRMVKHGSGDTNINDLAEAQLKAMPNYMEKSNYRIISICDFSGSMSCEVAGDVSAFEVSLSLGLYCSEKIGENNPFYRTLIPFSSTSSIVSWRNMNLAKAIYSIPNGYCGGTNIQSALDKILEASLLFNATNDQIPNVLLILSDMQFDQGVSDCDTPVNESLKKWKNAGYTIPKIIYWNLSGYSGSPATVYDKNVALVSGFSPSILTAVLGGEDFSPISIMERAIDKYKITLPFGWKDIVTKK